MNNIDTKAFREKIIDIMNEKGISAEELANISGVSFVTLYKILGLKTDYTQRAIVRKIAEATGHRFKIIGDKVEFSKIEKVDDNLNEVEKEMLEIFRRQNRTKQRMLVNLMELVCNLKGGDEEKGHSSNN